MTKTMAGIPEGDWDKQVALLGGGILQGRAWAVLQQKFGRTGYYASGTGWAWQAFLRQGRGVRYLYAPYGPVVRTTEDLEPSLRALTQAGRDLGADFVRFEPVGPAQAEALRALGARQMPEVQPQRTLVLRLDRSEDEIRSGISSSNRNRINSAAKRGIDVRSIARPTSGEIQHFIDMLHDTVARDAFHPYPDSYYRQTVEVLSAEHAATLYLATAEGAMTAGAIGFNFEGTSYYAHAAAYQEPNRKYSAAVSVLWRMIIDAKERGDHAFDFWGIAPTDDPGHPRAGFTRFKRSFGGETKEYAGTWELPLKPAKYQLYRLAKKALRLT